MTTPASALTPHALDALTRSRTDVRLLDVRTPGEYAAEHLPGSSKLPLDTCGMAVVLCRLPCNRAAAVDPVAVVRALLAGRSAATA